MVTVYLYVQDAIINILRNPGNLYPGKIYYDQIVDTMYQVIPLRSPRIYMNYIKG